MSMAVQHNLQAMNANRLLGTTTSSQSKSTEKLSSGCKINCAADDAGRNVQHSHMFFSQNSMQNQKGKNIVYGASIKPTDVPGVTDMKCLVQYFIVLQSTKDSKTKFFEWLGHACAIC